MSSFTEGVAFVFFLPLLLTVITWQNELLRTTQLSLRLQT